MKSNATDQHNQEREYQWSLYRAELAAEDERYRRDCEELEARRVEVREEWDRIGRWMFWCLVGGPLAILVGWMLTLLLG